MKLFLKLVITLFLCGFALLFFSDCSRRELLYKYLGLLLMTPAVTVTMVSIVVGVWAL